MKKKNKKVIIILIVLVALILGAFIFYSKFYLKDPNSFTLEENKWIDKNKYDVIDIAVLNDIPVLSYDGEGIIYNYLDYITEKHSLKFNVVPYKVDTTVEYDYKIDIVDEVPDKSFEIYKDNLILLSTNNIQYSDINEISNLRIGVLSSDKEKLSNYLNNTSITYVEYNNYTDLKNSIISAKTNIEQGNMTVDVDAIAVLKTVCTKEIIESNLNVAYHFNDLNKYFVLTTNGDSQLNSILNKSFNVFKEDDFEESYNETLLSNYYKFQNLTDVDQKTLKSKNYVFGFINYGIYNYLDDKEISGLNSILLKRFNEFSDLSISYTQYNSINKLVEDFNLTKIDFIFNNIDENSLKNSVYKTTNVFNKQLVVASDINSDIVIDNIKSLKDQEVLTIKDSYIEKYLKENDIRVKSYNNMEDLIKDFNNENITVLDMENYNYYKTSGLKNSRIAYVLNYTDKYNFIINNTENNKDFIDMFNFYLSFNSINKLTTVDYNNVAYENVDIIYLLIIIIVILTIYVVLDFLIHLKVMFKKVNESKKNKLTKEEKIKYIDQLTSLKNRNYLNSKIESWDDSEVYPQSIIVIDLNNVSYINDNYGREEGDKVITEAANILIQNQLQNSEIIRTDGNEFLIYLVGYNEKQIISYLRKLTKEFKNLSHGFGAASGYSVINDAIKTIDDAVNEATLAMKENKEDIDY